MCYVSRVRSAPERDEECISIHICMDSHIRSNTIGDSINFTFGAFVWVPPIHCQWFTHRIRISLASTSVILRNLYCAPFARYSALCSDVFSLNDTCGLRAAALLELEHGKYLFVLFMWSVNEFCGRRKTGLMTTHIGNEAQGHRMNDRIYEWSEIWPMDGWARGMNCKQKV